jgi:beta-glucanase (GH16 family)
MISMFICCIVVNFHSKGQNWVPVLWDDFNGVKLDSNTWKVGYPWGGSNNTNTFMLPGNISIYNGQLIFKATQDQYVDNGKVYDHTSGTISTIRGFQKGAFAIRFKASSLFWPAFWLYGGEGNEIDFFELGNDCNPVLGICSVDRTKMVHIGTSTGGGKWYDVNIDWSSDWHIIAGNWNGNSVDFYFDGKYIDSYTAHFKHALNLIIDLEVNDPAHNFMHTKIPSGSDFPNYMYIDWVRAWAPIDCNSKITVCTIDDEKDHIFTGGNIVLGKNTADADCGGYPCNASADCKIKVGQGNHLDLFATNGIELNPGFSVETDPANPKTSAYFSAQIISCKPDASQLIQTGLINNSANINPDSLIPPFNIIKLDMEIFPNPDHGMFTIRMLNISDNPGFFIAVFDDLGNLVLSDVENGSNSKNIDLTRLRQGIYFVRVNASNQILTRKIIRL